MTQAGLQASLRVQAELEQTRRDLEHHLRISGLSARQQRSFAAAAG